MSETHIITAEIREDVGKGASRRLRREGKIPAVLYGGEKDAQALTLNHKDILHDAENESFYSSIMQIQVADGRTQDVVVRDMHRHPYKRHILHLDFMRVSATEVLRIAIPIHFINEEKSEAGKASGVVIQHQMTEVEIDALPKDLPEYIEVDLSGLEPGGAVMLSEISVPEGVEIVELAQEGDADIMIANAVHISESQGTGAAAAAEAEALAEEELEIGDTPLEDSDEEGEAEDEAESDDGEKSED